jgi:hypothetical protein
MIGLFLKAKSGRAYYLNNCRSFILRKSVAISLR